MALSAIQPAGADTRSARPLTPPVSSQRTLAALRGLGRLPEPDDPATIRHTAAQLVSELFFKPLLAEMRALPFGNGVGHGGRGEEVFAERLDERLADAVTAAQRGGLVEQIVRRLRPPAVGSDLELTAEAPPPAGATADPRRVLWPARASLKPEPTGLQT